MTYRFAPRPQPDREGRGLWLGLLVLPSTVIPRQMSVPDSDHHRPVHGDHHGQSGHVAQEHAGHSVAMFRDKFWISLALTVPTLVWGHMLPGGARVHPADCAGLPLDRTGVWDGGVPVWRSGVPPGCLARAACPSAGDDDADRPRHFGRVPVQRGCNGGLSGHAALGGAGHAGHHHAAGSLDRDAVRLPGAGCPA